MRRASKGYTRMNTPLFQTMLVQGQNVQGERSTIPVESHHTPTSAPSTSQQPTSSPFMQTTHAALMPYDSPIPRVHSLGSDEGSLCNTPKMGRSGNDVPGALLHNTIAPVMRERPLSVV
ncbi:hypothetical protein Tco_0023690 [Tanacetum coccineum]